MAVGAFLTPRFATADGSDPAAGAHKLGSYLAGAHDPLEGLVDIDLADLNDNPGLDFAGVMPGGDVAQAEAPSPPPDSGVNESPSSSYDSSDEESPDTTDDYYDEYPGPMLGYNTTPYYDTYPYYDTSPYYPYYYPNYYSYYPYYPYAYPFGFSFGRDFDRFHHHDFNDHRRFGDFDRQRSFRGSHRGFGRGGMTRGGFNRGLSGSRLGLSGRRFASTRFNRSPLTLNRGGAFRSGALTGSTYRGGLRGGSMGSFRRGPVGGFRAASPSGSRGGGFSAFHGGGGGGGFHGGGSHGGHR